MVNFRYPCINNLGADVDDWIVGLRYPGSEFQITRCLGIDHEWQLSSAEADTTAYKSNGLWTSALLTPVFTKSSTHPSVGKYQSQWTVNSPAFLSGGGEGWSTWGKFGIEKRNWEYEGETKSFAIYKGELKTEIGTEKHTSIRNYAINIKEPLQDPENPTDYRCSDTYYKLLTSTPSGLLSVEEYPAYLYAPIIDSYAKLVAKMEAIAIANGLTYQINRTPNQDYSYIPYQLNSYAPIRRPDYYYYVFDTATDTIISRLPDIYLNLVYQDESEGYNTVFYDKANDPVSSGFYYIQINPRVLTIFSKGLEGFTCPNPPPPPPPPPNDPPPTPDDPQDIPIQFVPPQPTGHPSVFRCGDNLLALKMLNPQNIAAGIPYGFTLLHDWADLYAGWSAAIKDANRERISLDCSLGEQAELTEGDGPGVLVDAGTRLRDFIPSPPESYAVGVFSYPLDGNPGDQSTGRGRVFGTAFYADTTSTTYDYDCVVGSAGNERRYRATAGTNSFSNVRILPSFFEILCNNPNYDPDSEPPDNPPPPDPNTPPDPNAQINGSGSDRIEITGKTFLSDTITVDYTYTETASYIIDDFTGYKLTDKNITKSTELLQLQGVDAQITVETKMNEDFIDINNSTISVTAQYYLYSRDTKQSINTSSTFLVNCSTPLEINAETTAINAITSFAIAKRHYSGLSNGESQYTPNPFFTGLIGSQVTIAQNLDAKSWQVLALITGINGTENDNNFAVTSIDISVISVTEVPFTAFGTTNGVVYCNNGSFLNAVIFASSDHGYIDSKALEYLEKPLKNIGQFNLLGDFLYISRNPLSDEQRNFVEVWQFTLTDGNSLNLIQTEASEDNIFPYSSGQSLLSTSYYSD